MSKVKEFIGHPKTLVAVKIIILLAAIFILLLALVMVGNAVINKNYQNVFLPGTKLGSVDIGNLDFDQAQEKVRARVDQLDKQGFVYVAPGKKATVLPSVSASNSVDISYPVVIWKTDESLQAIKNWQADNSLFNLIAKVYVWRQGKTWPLAYTWDQEQHLKILQDDLVGVLPVKQEASFSFTDSGLTIKPEQAGKTFDFQRALKQTQEQIKYLNNTEIALVVINDAPDITRQSIEQWQARILSASSRGDLTLTWEKETWTVANATWRQWLRLVSDHGQIRLVFDPTEVDKYLTSAGIKTTVEIPVQDAKFKLDNGKVNEFMASRQGRAIALAKTLDDLNQRLNNNGVLNTALVIETVEPKVMNSDVNDLGISAIIGTGISDFKNSPPNRIFNINVGAKALAGLLISPGEEFSLMTALGEIDGEHGYKQELVIKDNRTTPEYGGGLCQIGTTVFRAALGTGLPITERHNHSYRVTYYEPAGMDATIYSPKPDLKFINDTGHYILIQYRIEGTKLYFDFWGTPDGRVASTTKPIIYNQVAPPPKKEIKTVDLAVGQTKCTEHAHSGADAKFDYTVLYPNTLEPKKTTFNSHYVPWQEVCLVGATQEEVDAQKNGTVPGSSTSTPSTTTPSTN